jgi:hypothetical protein
MRHAPAAAEAPRSWSCPLCCSAARYGAREAVGRRPPDGRYARSLGGLEAERLDRAADAEIVRRAHVRRPGPRARNHRRPARDRAARRRTITRRRTGRRREVRRPAALRGSPTITRPCAENFRHEARLAGGCVQGTGTRRPSRRRTMGSLKRLIKRTRVANAKARLTRKRADQYLQRSRRNPAAVLPDELHRSRRGEPRESRVPEMARRLAALAAGVSGPANPR